MNRCTSAPSTVRPDWRVLAPLLTGILTTSLAAGMINTALPRLTADLDLSPSSRTWAADIYPLCLAMGIVVAARAGDAVGRRRILALGLGLFAASSAAAATASSGAVLIGARATLGFAGAMVVAGVVSTIGAVFDGHARTVANGLWVAVFGAATALGPLLGGILTESVGWRAVFWASVPTAVVGLLFAITGIPETRAERPPSWDPLSIVASAAGLGLLVYGIHHVAAAPIPGGVALTLGAVALVAFARRQRTHADPLIDVTLFARRRFSAATIGMAIAAGAGAASSYLLSVHLQASGRGPFAVGLLLLPLAAATTAGGLVAPAIGRRLAPPTVMRGGLATISIGLVLIALIPSSTVVGLAAIGLGFGLVGTLGTSELFDASEPSRVAQVGAVQEVAFAVGGGAGIAVFGSIAAVHGFTAACMAAAATGALACALPYATRSPGRRRAKVQNTNE